MKDPKTRSTSHMGEVIPDICPQAIFVDQKSIKCENRTHVHHCCEKCLKDPTCSIFLKKGLFKRIKNYIPMCQMRKCKVKCQKDPTCGIFLKGRLFKDVFWVSHSCTRSSYPLLSIFINFDKSTHLPSSFQSSTRAQWSLQARPAAALDEMHTYAWACHW